ncbi:1,6-anhydro-N-acetylmuramyl-L-alanine amidase AmpD [Methylomarinum sp. Ch1-1]|uniref:1,6-anhydro-N-acetylmuramyl-L-alanine amidase AmpD n=1 Tax=Methylomarinum roseum TaxID=3067653 RepID=A0AAU7NWH1_9GAMM|nr:1,6-anhydro-N-acetylmuramyl-L-alanine amidase AmpD [Methylomarinum sp. Ch1-1]MDP4522633.1 1,6-anhydro-N-acetylmuramyl-L-alanine amidase AmpD [Methylomarinum sp. Ch1-1]
MNIHNHCISTAQQIASPNFDQRPDPEDISLLVIHCISLPPQQFGGDYIAQLFCNRLDPEDDPYFKQIYRLKVSAHLLIRRDGEMIQFVPFDRRAWHAGQSCFAGRDRCNDFSIGIELEGCESTPYSDEQYQQLAAVTRLLLENYPGLNKQAIAGHSDIAPGRKTDPGPSFDWDRLLSLLD